MEAVINRNNYEMYFLLYADNELTAAERLAVEAFLQQHPDLRPEFDAIMQTRLPAEPLVFDAKNLLYKPETTAIALHNYETFFILYYDNELDAAERKAVEDFVAANPALQEEFLLFGSLQIKPSATEGFPRLSQLYKTAGVAHETIIDYIHNELSEAETRQLDTQIVADAALQETVAAYRQTQLQPEMHIQFPDKEQLYRREEKRAPVVPLWLRYAAAAAVLLFITWAGFLRNNGGSVTPGSEAVAKTGNGQPVPASKTNEPAPAGNNGNNNTVQPGNTNNNMAVNDANSEVLNNVRNTNTAAGTPVNTTLNDRNGVTSETPARNTYKQALQPQANNNPVAATTTQEQPELRLPESIRKMVETPKPQEAAVVAQAEPGKLINQEPAGSKPAEMAIAANAVNEENRPETQPSGLTVMNIPADNLDRKTGLKSVGRRITRFLERKIKNNGRPFSIGGVEVALAR